MSVNLHTAVGAWVGHISLTLEIGGSKTEYILTHDSHYVNQGNGKGPGL